ncbi:MAG: DUF3293 domain-containing protein [Gammaproteobacteria bacterium]|nr:DUF3293 domain-containing protein [Gammaproteobacteria bacterium]
MNSELEKAYLDTTYSVFVDGEKYDIKIGKQIPPVINHLLENENEKSAVILTAWNPRSKALPLSDNKSRNTKLNSFLKNYRVFNAVGQGDDLSWSGEESFFILGIKKDKMEQLAVDFEQYAYVWLECEKPASLVFTNIWYE